ncbi:MAG: GerAB/ArcD/ProY family transporter, partial [Clostridiales bacterium]
MNKRPKRGIYDLQISSLQGILLIALISWGGLIPFFSIGQSLGRNIWVAYLLNFGMGLIYFFFLKEIAKAYPHSTLTAINQEVFGKKWGQVVNIIFLLQFISALSYYIMSGIYFWTSLQVHSMPIYVMGILIVILLIFAGKMGLEVIARSSLFISLFITIMAFGDTILVAEEMDFARFLPIADISWSGTMEAALNYFTCQFILMPLIFMFIPFIADINKKKAQPKQSAKIIFWGIFIPSIYLLLNIIRNVTLFGDSIFIEYYPTVQALRMVEWNTAVIRLETIGFLAIISISLSFLMLLFYCSCRIAADICQKRDHRKMLWPLGIISLLLLAIIYTQTDFINDSLILS